MAADLLVALTAVPGTRAGAAVPQTEEPGATPGHLPVELDGLCGEANARNSSRLYLAPAIGEGRSQAGAKSAVRLGQAADTVPVHTTSFASRTKGVQPV